MATTDTDAASQWGEIIALMDPGPQAAVLDAWLSGLVDRGPLAGRIAIRQLGNDLRDRLAVRRDAGPAISAALLVLADAIARKEGR